MTAIPTLAPSTSDEIVSSHIKKEDALLELRQNTFDLFLVFVSFSSAVIIWLANIKTRTSPPIVAILWISVELICILSWFLRRRYLRFAIRFALSGLWAVNAIAVQVFVLPFFWYLFVLLILATSIIARRRTAFTMTVFTTIYLSFVLNGDLLTGPLLPVLMAWFTLLTSFIAFHSLYEALDMAWSYQDYAVQQMFEAREHRANLMKTTKALNDVRQDLERANTQLTHAHRAAEEARRLKAQFAANVSHELRTPINLIVGFSETIVVSPESYGVPLPPVYWADMNTIYRSAKHLQSLINDVLDVSQIEAGKMAIVKEEINSRQVIDEAANIARDLIESRGLHFKVVLPRPMPTMYLDRTRIRQVILNLLSNAARFTNTGTITLAATVEEAELRVTVSDTGIGIPASDINRVFEEFHQVEGSLSRRRGGSGLGLTLSKQFVEQHGGKIWAESDGIPGKGSTFTISLPLIDQSVTQKVGTGPLGAANRDGARYFVVMDEDPAILQLFKRYSNKHRAVSTDSYDEALRLVDAIQPAALVINERAESAQMLSHLHDLGNQTPVITCAMPSGRRGLAIPADTALLEKPITGDALRQAMERIAPKAKSILLIAEDREMIRMFTSMIQGLPIPYQLWKAYSNEEGLALMAEQHPDAVVFDIMSLDKDAIKIIQHIHNDPMLRKIPLIVSSASGDLDGLSPASEGLIRIQRNAGFQPMELVRCVEALVDVLTPIANDGQLATPINTQT
jgi:signal transduction histidine kinase/CheY-like chemotaxis protein